MNARGVTLQAGFAIVGLVAAFLVWQREPEGMPGEVTVLDISKRALERVRYDDEKRFVELFRGADEELWVRLGDKPPPPPPPGAVADGGVADGGVVGPADGGTPDSADAGTQATPPPPPRELRGNEMAKNLFARLAPLKANRALGELDAKKQEELGLTQSQRKLVLTANGREHAFTLASPMGAAWGSPYLRREDGRVFLLGPSILPDLEGASTRLVDRRMHTFDLGEVETFTVSTNAQARTFVLSGKPPGPVTVAPQDAPDKPEEFVRNWHERVWRLLPLEFFGRGQEPPGGAPEEVFRVEYKRGDKAVGHVTVARGAKGDFYARTEHTPGWVRLQGGMDTLASEAVKVASGG